MTNSLIPYSFIPGTKAKASEVNANFLSLAEAIETNHTNALNEIADLNTQIAADISETSAQLSKIDLSNTNLITNCILSAPNGVAGYNTATITIKGGIKVLIPNGFNTDGTLKNIEYVVEEDISEEQVVPNLESFLLVCDKSQDPSGISTCAKRSFYVQNSTPTNILTTDLPVWYKPCENKYYRYSRSGNWNEYLIAPIASFCTDSNKLITNVQPLRTNLLKQKDYLEIMNWSTPDLSARVQKALGTTHTAESNGYLYGNAFGNSSGASVLTVNGIQIHYGSNSHGNTMYDRFWVLSKGDSYCVTNVVGDSQTYLYFVPMKGVTENA